LPFTREAGTAGWNGSDVALNRRAAPAGPGIWSRRGRRDGGDPGPPAARFVGAHCHRRRRPVRQPGQAALVRGHAPLRRRADHLRWRFRGPWPDLGVPPRPTAGPPPNRSESGRCVSAMW